MTGRATETLRRQRKGTDLMPLYAEIDVRQYNYLEKLSRAAGQTKAKTLTQLLKLAEDSKMFHMEP